MVEESLETSEVQEKLNEALERAEKAGEAKALPGWMRPMSLSTAIIAVLAAIASLQSGSLSNDALLGKNQAVLYQAQASDQWAYYQAKGIKANIAAGQSDVLSELKPDLAPSYLQESQRYKTEQDDLKKTADALEQNVKDADDHAEKLLHAHHQFAIAVTLFQIAIALSAIAALTRQKSMWILGLLISAGGVALFIYGFLIIP